MQTNPGLCAVVGLSIAEILNALEENVAPRDNNFSSYVAMVCSEKYRVIHELYKDAFPREVAMPAVMIPVLQIMDNCKLANGIHVSLTPVIVKDKITVSVNTDHENLSVTAKGLEYLKNASSAASLFVDRANYGPTFANLVIAQLDELVASLN